MSLSRRGGHYHERVSPSRRGKPLPEEGIKKEEGRLLPTEDITDKGRILERASLRK